MPITKSERKTLIDIAVEGRYEELQDAILLHGIHELETVQDDRGRNIMHFLGIDGHHACAELLIQHGWSLFNTRDEFNLTPLGWACIRKHIDVISLLMINGAVDQEDHEYAATTRLPYDLQVELRARLECHYLEQRTPSSSSRVSSKRL